MAVIDVCTFNNEQSLWKIHYHTLKNHVDQFVVVEFDKTFSGKLKGPSFPVEKYPGIKYCFLTETDYGKYREMAESSPNTVGAAHWKLEFAQKESIKDCLTHLNDDDIVFIGDVDEVWKPSSVHLGVYRGGFKLPLMVYTYYLNNRSTEKFWGTYVGQYGRDIKDKCLNHLRSDSYKLNPDLNDESNYCGWHFTSMGGPEKLRAKLTDSYTQESYAIPMVLENLEYNMASNKDFLGRDFTYMIDESEWPEFLRGNRDKYKHLIK